MNNMVGWVIAVVVLVIIVSIISFVIVFPPHSSPVESAKPGALDLKVVAVDLTKVIPAAPSGSGNAADDYRRAVSMAVDNETLLEDLDEALASYEGESPTKDPIPQTALKIAQEIGALVASGAAKAEMNYPLEKVEVCYKIPEPYELAKVSDALYRLAWYHSKVTKDKAQAEKVLQNQFVLGYHMAKGRLMPYFVWRGLHIQRNACDELAALYSEWPERSNKSSDIRSYRLALDSVISFFDTKARYVNSIDPEPGDVFNIVENDKDPCWRIQGILTLGVIKFTPKASSRGDMKYTQRLLEKLIASPNELERNAAKAAKEFRVEDFRIYGNKNSQY